MAASSALIAALGTPLFTGAAAGLTPAVDITEFPTPTASSSPVDITVGPDGALWFTEGAARQIGRITTGGVVSEYPLPPARGSSGDLGTPTAITTGPDGNLWFGDSFYGFAHVARMTTDGHVDYVVVWSGGNSLSVEGIAAGPDGAIWATAARSMYNSGLVRVGMDMAIAGGYTLTPEEQYPRGVVAAGGLVWFTAQSYRPQMVRVDPGGAKTDFALGTDSDPHDVALGPDGALWFTEAGANKIGRLTTDGVVTHEFPVPTADSGLSQITAGPDGALWFTETAANQIGRIDTAGRIQEFLLPTPASEPRGIAAGPDGNIWFVESNGSKVGRLTPPSDSAPSCTPPATPKVPVTMFVTPPQAGDRPRDCPWANASRSP